MPPPLGSMVQGSMYTQVRRRWAATIMYVQAAAGEAESDMKRNAPWDDITGNARGGLRGETVVEQSGTAANSVSLVLGHSVDYGIWLEVANGGKYAIVGPTTVLYHDRIVGAIQRIWGPYA